MRALSGLVGLQVVASVGTAAWWVYWFASGSYAHGAACDLAYENAFPVGDLVMAGLVGATAWGVHRRAGWALTVGFVAAGMSLSLAGLDTTHNLLTHGFDGSIGTILRKAVFAVVNGAVGIGTLAILPGQAGVFVDPPAPTVGRPAVGAALGLGVFGVFGACLAWLALDRPDCFGPIERSWLGPAGFGAVLAGMSARGIGGGPARPDVLAVAGVAGHAGLVLAGFALLQGAGVDGVFAGLACVGAMFAGVLARPR